MALVRFTATQALGIYQNGVLTLTDGTTVEVSNEVAESLCRRFPGNFTLVGQSADKQVVSEVSPAPAEDKKQRGRRR